MSRWAYPILVAAVRIFVGNLSRGERHREVVPAVQREAKVLLQEVDVELCCLRQIVSMGARACSMGEPMALLVSASIAGSRPTPPRSASNTPSPKASVCTPRLMLIASLTSSAVPHGDGRILSGIRLCHVALGCCVSFRLRLVRLSRRRR